MSDMSILDWVILGALGGLGVVGVVLLAFAVAGALAVLWMWITADLPEVELPRGFDEFERDDAPRDFTPLDARASGVRHPSLPLHRYLDQRCDDEHARNTGKAGGEA